MCQMSCSSVFLMITIFHVMTRVNCHSNAEEDGLHGALKCFGRIAKSRERSDDSV